MDFHSLSRRELQSLCKRNSIHANMTNAAMADALAALRSVEGLEELQEGRQYLSPKKAEAAGSPELPKTTTTTGRRRRRTSARLPSRRAAAPQQGSPLPRSLRVAARPPGVLLNLDGEGSVEEEKVSVPETLRAPVTAQKKEEEERTVGVTTRRRARQPPAGVAVGSTSTRRSARGRKAAAAAATKMADLTTSKEQEQEQEQENDVAENVTISIPGPAMEEGEERGLLKIASKGQEENVAKEDKRDEQEQNILEASDEQEVKGEENVQEATVENPKKDQNGTEEEEEGREETGGDDGYEEVDGEVEKKKMEAIDEPSPSPVLDPVSSDSDRNNKAEEEEEGRLTVTLTKAGLDSTSLRRLRAMYCSIFGPDSNLEKWEDN